MTVCHLHNRPPPPPSPFNKSNVFLIFLFIFRYVQQEGTADSEENGEMWSDGWHQHQGGGRAGTSRTSCRLTDTTCWLKPQMLRREPQQQEENKRLACSSARRRACVAWWRARCCYLLSVALKSSPAAPPLCFNLTLASEPATRRCSSPETPGIS